MRKMMLVPALAVVAGCAPLLGGCGDSHPIAAESSAIGSSAPPTIAPPASVPVYTPSSHAFVLVAAGSLAASPEASQMCNIDAIDNAPAGSKPLSHGGSALFAGWAASGGGTAVPGSVAIVLQGAQDYQVEAPTGARRLDVASANHKPALANSGYVVRANLSAVAPGDYKVELRYATGGKVWLCAPGKRITIQ
jgi:hypothetical protein